MEQGTSQESFPLEPGRFQHCSIQVSDSAIIMTGGLDGYGIEDGTRVSQFSFDDAGQVTFTELPRLTHGRAQHACGAYQAGESQVS